MASGVNFEALGISNPPSWSVLLPNDLGGTQLVQVPQAPEVEGLTLPPNLEVITSFWITHYYHLRQRSKPKVCRSLTNLLMSTCSSLLLA